MILEQLHDRYLDTAGGSARAQGFACRIRRKGDYYQATLKGLGTASGAIHRRVEHQVELNGPLSPSDWPASEARTLALRLVDDQPLVTLFEIEQERYSRSLYGAAREVAQLQLARVRVYREGVEANAYLELEAELMPEGNESDLQEISSEIEAVWGLAPEQLSKFERALALFKVAPASEEETEPGTESQPSASEQPIAGATTPGASSQLIELLDEPGIGPDDPMSEAGRKTFRFHFRRMLYNEPGTRLGEDIDALHDMRVATRRMRAAFRVFDSHFEPKVIAPYLKGLKRTGRALGRVRDLDVFHAKILSYLDTLPDSKKDSLDDLLAAWEAQRETARDRMNAYLGSAKYARFVDRFGEFVETEGMGSLAVAPDGDEPRPYRVRHVAPMVIYERLAAVRAYDEWVTIPNPPLERLHALRIACKRLRYTMEFFQEVLGPDTRTAIKRVVIVQDHLGELQDAVVATGILKDFLRWGTWGQRATGEEGDAEATVISPGVEAYLAAKQRELEHLLSTFPEVWQQLNGVEFSRMVAETVVEL